MFKHLKERKISYVSHGLFALGIAIRLGASAVAFAIHAILPFVPIPESLNLEATGLYLFEKDNSLSD